MWRMAWHLLRRQWTFYVTACLLLTGLWVCLLGVDSYRTGIRWSLFVFFNADLALMMAPWMFQLNHKSAKLYFALPLSAKQRGHAVWMLMSVVAPFVAVMAKVLATLILSLVSSRTPSDAPWLLASCGFDVAYAGTMTFLMVAAPQSAKGPWQGAWVALWLLVYLAGWYPFVTAVPIAGEDLQWWAWALLAGGLCLGFASWAGAPALSRYNSAGLPRSEASIPTLTKPVVPGRSPHPNRLAGVWRILRLQALWATFVTVVVVFLAAAMDVYYLGNAEGRAWLAHALKLMSSIDIRQSSEVWGWFLIVSPWPWDVSIRPLRKLPLSTVELNLLLLARPLATWLTFWALMGAANVCVGGAAPPLGGLGSLAGFLGASCLANAAALRLRKFWIPVGVAIFVMSVGALGVGLPLKHVVGPLTPIAVQCIALAWGLVTIGIAAVWNHHSLTHVNGIYKWVPFATNTPFSLPTFPSPFRR